MPLGGVREQPQPNCHVKDCYGYCAQHVSTKRVGDRTANVKVCTFDSEAVGDVRPHGTWDVCPETAATEINPQRPCVFAKSVGEARPSRTDDICSGISVLEIWPRRFCGAAVSDDDDRSSELVVSCGEPWSTRSTGFAEFGGDARPSGTRHACPGTALLETNPQIASVNRTHGRTL